MCRNHPPFSGAIFWARMLFERLKKPVLTFQNVEELKGNIKKVEAFDNYLTVSRTIKQYEQTKYEMWLEQATPIVSTTFTSNILKIINTLMKDSGKWAHTNCNVYNFLILIYFIYCCIIVRFPLN